MIETLTFNDKTKFDEMRQFADEFVSSALDQINKFNGNTYTMREAIGIMYNKYVGCMQFVVSLPEWGGFWFIDDDNNISVITKDNEYTKTPWFGDYQSRNDWHILYRGEEIENRINNAKNKK